MKSIKKPLNQLLSIFQLHKSYYLFVLLSTLFVALFFTSTDFLTIPFHTVKDVCILFLQWFIVAFCLFFVMLLLSLNSYLFLLLMPLLTFISALLAYFRFTMNAALTPMILDAAMDNDITTSAQLVSSGLLVYVVLSVFISLLLVYFRFKLGKIKNKRTLLFTGISGMLLIMNINSFNRPISERIPFNIYYTISKYNNEKQSVNEKRTKLTDGVACIDGKPITVVFVLGESLRPDHLGLNGYARNTTPLLSKEHIISFPGVYTEYTYTNRSIPHILTRADSIHPDRAYTEESFISLFNASNFYTVWLANQESAQTYSYFMHECDSLFYANIEKSSYVFDNWVDGSLLPLFDNALKSPDQKRLVILHTIGSHWWYNSHYTDQFAVYQPTTKSKIISSCTTEEMINSYDNTILYTDYFLKELIDRLKNERAILIYLSDHGEALGEDGIWLHAAESAYTHTTACMVWMSEQYKSDYPERYEEALKNREKRMRTDFLFHSLLDAAGIDSHYKEPSLSIFTSEK
nr:phosphoethanolamine transferase [uncultured Macellibacteroides sp.]